jgi:threonine dehydratase
MPSIYCEKSAEITSGRNSMILLEDVQRAAEVLQGKIIRTPLVYSPTFSRVSGAEVYLKLENLQIGGSFKVRGATYKIQSRLEEIGQEGVVAASAGNHAQGVTLAARGAGLSATIVMPEWVSISKQQATRGYGAEIILKGKSLAESIQFARELAQTGKTFIHPYDDLEIITGQATIGLEIMQDLPDADMIFVPIGGGGLISGISSAAKAMKPDIRIVGVEAAACPSAYQSRLDGKVTEVEAKKSIADGITVKQVGEIDFPIIEENVDEIVLVDEDQISAAISTLLERKKVLAEGAGAVALAALLNSKVEITKGSKVVLVISGGNVDAPLLDRILRQGLLRNGRIMQFSVCLEDVPGSLAQLLDLVARRQGNILHIHHARWGRNLPIHLIGVELEVETRGFEHIEKIAEELQEAGYRIRMK